MVKCSAYKCNSATYNKIPGLSFHRGQQVHSRAGETACGRNTSGTGGRHAVRRRQSSTDETVKLSATIVNMELELHILPPSNRISAIELSKLLEDKTNLLIDVRAEAEFDMCHIEGAENVPIDKVEVRIEELAGRVKENGGAVIFICRRGNDSQIAAKMLLTKLPEAQKFKIKDMVGGLHLWAQDVDSAFPIY